MDRISPFPQLLSPSHILYTGSNLLVPRVPLDVAVRRYRFILVIDGNCAAWRLQELLGEWGGEDELIE